MRFTSYNLEVTFSWTAHRFSGGLLALDLANTVVCREDAARRVDRFTDPDHVEGFAHAARQFRKLELAPWLGRRVIDPAPGRALLKLREAIDVWGRMIARGAQPSAAEHAAFLGALARAFTSTPKGESSLAALAARSALQLLDPAIQARLRICPNCHWLFLDRSKNGSRRWCDMSVCGNRAKARTHYHRHNNSHGAAA